MSAFQNDLTQGSVTKQLIRFSMPFLLSNIIQALYSVADMLIVGWFFGENGISGVSIGRMMKYMVWFLLALLVVLMITTYVPAFTMFAFA